MAPVEFMGQIKPNGTKRSSLPPSPDARPVKRTRVLLKEDSEGETSADGSRSGAVNDSNVSATDYVLAVNQDFARRFEHNKKREELHQRMNVFLPHSENIY